jgi:hypothetical protein
MWLSRQVDKCLDERDYKTCSGYRFKGLFLMSEEHEEIPIGKLSQRTNVHIETIRYYEKIGLLPAPGRKEATGSTARNISRG